MPGKPKVCRGIKESLRKLKGAKPNQQGNKQQINENWVCSAGRLFRWGKDGSRPGGMWWRSPVGKEWLTRALSRSWALLFREGGHTATSWLQVQPTCDRLRSSSHKEKRTHVSVLALHQQNADDSDHPYKVDVWDTEILHCTDVGCKSLWGSSCFVPFWKILFLLSLLHMIHLFCNSPWVVFLKRRLRNIIINNTAFETLWSSKRAVYFRPLLPPVQYTETTSPSKQCSKHRGLKWNTIGKIPTLR